MQRKLLNPSVLEQRPPKTGRVEIRDSLCPLILRITAQGNRTFVVRARIKGQRQPIRLTYQSPAHISVLEDARSWAVDAVGKCIRGIDPRETKAGADALERAATEKRARNRFGAVADQFLEKHAARNRSYEESKRIIDLYLRPRWEDRQICEISRPDIVLRLDQIEAGTFKGHGSKAYGGPVMADRVLAQLRKLMNWHATRDPEYVSPIVKGMARTKPRDRARTRVLSDEEIRLIWPHLIGTYGAVLKTLFYTAQRVGEVSQMRRSQIGSDAIWSIPLEASKTKRLLFVPLTPQALSVIQAQPEIGGSDLVFGAPKDATKEIKNWSALKAELDARVTESNGGEALPNWTQHDIRRTCRTLMSRAGIRPDICERVLGHVISGVAGVYDRHAYGEEKRQALEALASLLNQINAPAPESVVKFVRGAAT
jgi:integrase